MKILLTVLFVLLVKFYAIAENEHEGEPQEHSDQHLDHHAEEAFGEGKAITAIYDEGKKFKLSKASQALLKIKHRPFVSSNKGVYVVPKSALVRFQGGLGIFVQRDEWFQLVEIDFVKFEDDNFIFNADDLKKPENIVVTGVPMLRVAHLQATGQGGQGHAH